jgi:replicative superfamily II helicase
MKQLFLFFILIASQYNGLSQVVPPASAREKMNDRVEVRRAAFLSHRLQLTPEEAQVFFPLFNEYVAKTKLIRQQAKSEKKIEDFNDAEAEKAIAAQFDVESRIIDLKKEYYQKFKKVLSSKRIALLYKTEREFKGELLNELQNRRGGQMRKPRFAPNEDR